MPTMAILLQKMGNLKNDTNLRHCHPLVDSIINGVKRRFDYIFEDARLLTASAAHPMFRLEYIPTRKKTSIVAKLRAEVKQRQSQDPDNAMTTEDEEPTEDDDAVTGYFPTLRPPRVVDEVDVYLKSTETKLVDVFKNLPMMKEIFLEYNTGFPASAACERLFSVGKDIFRPKRNRLSDANFEKLLLCRVNHMFM